MEKHLRSQVGSLRGQTTRKIALVESASGYRCLLRGSMNLNFNPRFEAIRPNEGGPDFDLVALD